MSPETIPDRFTLRKEYFGGLVYDAATVLGFGGEIKGGKLIGEDPQCFVPLINE